MMDCASPTTKCSDNSDKRGQMCGTAFSYPYFVSFIILCCFLVS